MTQGHIDYGLKPLPFDERDFPMGAIVDLPKLEDLPESFEFPKNFVLDQGNTDYCTAFATDLASSYQEGIEPCPEWGFAASKYLSGDKDEWGQDLRSACKRHVKLGMLPKIYSPYSLKTHTDDFLRDYDNWPDLTSKTLFHAKKTFFKVSGPYSSYDNIRATMIKLKIAPFIGLLWSWSLSDTELKDIKDNGFGHAVCVVGYNSKGLIIQNSAGESAGDGGRHTVSKEVINHFVEKYGAFAFLDLSPEEAKQMLEQGIKLGTASIFKSIWLFLKSLV